MTFRRSDLQEAFFVPGTQPFRVYGYGTTDPLEEVLRQDYFAAARALLRPGELKRGGTRAKAVEASGRDKGISGIADDFSGTSVNYLTAGACTNRDTLCTIGATHNYLQFRALSALTPIRRAIRP